MSKFIPLKVNKEGTRGSFYCVLVLGEMFPDKKLTEENVLALCQLCLLWRPLTFFPFVEHLFYFDWNTDRESEGIPQHSFFILFRFYFYFHFNFQAQPIPSELTAKLLGNRVAVSPIVTIEPRRRKFHKPITLTIPVPVAASKGMINQYNGDTPTLRLLCSITGRSRLTVGDTADYILRLYVVYFTLGVVVIISMRYQWY